VIVGGYIDMDLITSRNNPKIKLVRSLRHRKGRKKEGLFLIEGIRHVGEAIEAGVSITGLYYAPDLLKSEFALNLLDDISKTSVPCIAATGHVFRSIVSKENPQGILAVAQQTLHDLDKQNPKNFPWGVALVSPQDPGNLGAILRTVDSDSTGASGVLVLDGGVDIYHPAAVRASMGAHFWRPIIQSTFDDFTAWALEHRYKIYGTSANGSTDYRQVDKFHKPCVLLLGSERDGLTDTQAAICHEVIRLPMVGRATSLNLAVAAGVLLYDMLGKFD